ncbi:cytidylyltransferase domain-containing protein [Kiloniella sp.]|uniref:acylneuraminate cytidylyltransferase family protein n=1 Tax=Kiloniella sp. TaxID=1938587 RepID=UPI003B022764
MKRLAIIPARGGSKRIPQKNIRDFCGMPMAVHILKAACESGLFDAIHVSTDCEQIAKVVVDHGFPVDFMRPASLADDMTPIMPVMKFVAEEYKRRGQEFDQVWLLMACAPLTSTKDLINAEKLFVDAGAKSPLLGVCEYPVPVEWAFKREEDGRLLPLQPGMFAVRSQDLEKRYFDAGSFSIFPASIILGSQGAGSDVDYIGYELSKGTAIDIDDEQDWKLAEAIFRSWNSL